jgi:transposase
VAGRLVRTLIGQGAAVVWVPPKLMAQCRASARTRGKSDPIDALAIARAAVREPDLPTAHLDDVAADVRLLCDRREHLVGWRTQTINQLRWHLHDLAPHLDTASRLTSARQLDALATALGALPVSVRRDLALALVAEIRRLGEQIRQLEKQLATLVSPLAPTLLSIVGVNVVTAAKILGEVAGITRFRSAAAFAMHTGAAPIPIWSSNRPQVRLNRGGNRQLNACPTASPSPSSETTPTPRPGTSGGPASTRAPPAKPRSAPSNDTSQTSSTAPFTPTTAANINSQRQVDIEASLVG